MFSDNLQEFLALLDKEGELLRIKKEVSPDLEISEIYLRHIARGEGGKALLFENVTNSKIPVAINLFGSFRRLRLAFGNQSIDEIAKKIRKFVNPAPPKGVVDFLKMGWEYKDLFRCPPKKVQNAPCQKRVYTGDAVDLSMIPVLKTWPLDGGPFITLPLVFTRSLDGTKNNLGMYRMQVYNKNTTGMHWQIHKDGSHFFQEYKKAGKRMPVAVAIGADPITVYSATAPLPPGIFEPFFAGFLRKKPVEMVRCVSVDLEVPAQSEIVLEGYVYPEELLEEGPFGDHTGYYTPIEPYPIFHVTAITMRENPVYHTTVVGRSPMEDCYLAHATERLFLPMLQGIAPEVLDQHLPWDGTFHNCQIFSIEKHYPYQGRRLMSHIWGFTQASFCKCLITTSKDAPIHEDEKFLAYFLDHFDAATDLFLTEGIVDALDHSANQPLFGGKIGIDISHPINGEPGYLKKTQEVEPYTPIRTEWLDKELGMLDSAIIGCSFTGLKKKNPLLVLRVHKKQNPGIIKRLVARIFEVVNLKRFKIFILVDEKSKNLKDGHEIAWRVFSNTDGQRDFYRQESRVLIDATYKLPEEGFTRVWPQDMQRKQEIVDIVNRKFTASELGLEEPS